MPFITSQRPAFPGNGVTGPGPGAGTSTDNAVARWNGASGNSIQNSGVIIDDSNNVTGIQSLTVTTLVATTTITTGDNIILLNNDIVGIPTEDAGIEVQRGSSTNSTLIWDETGDFWAAGLVGSTSKLLRSVDLGNLTAAGTDGIAVTGGTGATIGSASVAQHVADATHNGYLASTDFVAFNAKQPAGNYITALTGDGTASGPGSATLTLATVNGNVGSFGSASQVPTFTANAKGLLTAAANVSIQIAESQVTNLVSDLAGKQATGNYITALTGDVTASGPGSVAATIAIGAVTDTKGSLAGKPSVAVVATTNQTLSGVPTIDGISTLTSGSSLVLLSAQSSASQNGPWIVNTGAWTRPTWFPSGGTTQAFQFITVLIRLGTVYQGSTWRMTSSGAHTIDTTAQTWVVTPIALNSNTTTGNLSQTITTISSNVTLSNNTIHLVDTSSARSLALPDPAGSPAKITVKDKAGLAGTNNITITRFGSESIEGLAASLTLAADWGAWNFVTDGTNWFLV